MRNENYLDAEEKLLYILLGFCVQGIIIANCKKNIYVLRLF